MKAITGSFTITAVVDGENAVAYEMIDNGSYFRYDPNTKKVDMKVLGTLYKIEGTKRTPMVGYQIFINDDGNIINDNANDSNYLTTKTDGSFSYTADSDWVDLLSQSTKIHAEFYTNDGLAAVLNIQKITDGENGKDGETYEIVLANAYCVYNPNEESDNVIGLIEGHLYKVVGDKRVAMSGVSIEYGYSETIGQELDGEPLYDTTDTEDDGFFTSGGWFGDTYGKEYVGNSKSIIARYKKDGNVVAQVNVGISQYGLNGLKGERGAPLRVTEWVDGWTYYNGKGANDPYTDVVKYGNYWYLCKTNHRSNQVNHPSGTTENTSYWEAASQFDMIATKVFLAANAHIDLLGSNTINVMDSLGNTTAGMSGGDGVQLWAGGKRDTAKFRVKEDGDVYVEGTVNAKNLFRSICIVFAKGTYLSLDNSGIYKEYAYILHTDAIYDYIDNSVGDLTDEQKEEWKSYYIAGTYVPWKDTPLYTQVEGGVEIGQMDGVLKCTYNADCIQLVDEGSTEFPDEAIIYLPNPKDFAGKFVDVDHSSTSRKTLIVDGNEVPKVAFVRCVGEWIDGERNTNNFLIGLGNSNGELTGQPYHSITINAGEVRRFYSTGEYWLPL